MKAKVSYYQIGVLGKNDRYFDIACRLTANTDDPRVAYMYPLEFHTKGLTEEEIKDRVVLLLELIQDLGYSIIRIYPPHYDFYFELGFVKSEVDSYPILEKDYNDN